MTCDAMLVRMLDADLEELKGRGSSPLAKHVRTCRQCGAVADRLLAGTRALAQAAVHEQAFDFAARTTRPSRRLVVGAGVTSLAASVIIGVLVQYSLHARISFDPPVRENVTLPRTPPELASDRTGMITARIAAPLDRTVTRGYPIEPLAIEATRFADATPVTPVPLTPTLAVTSSVPADEPAVVSVDPPMGTRATIMRGRNPAITVVWLY